MGSEMCIRDSVGSEMCIRDRFKLSESPVFQNWFLKIFIEFYTSKDFDSHKMSSLIVLISFQGGGGVRTPRTPPPPGYGYDSVGPIFN